MAERSSAIGIDVGLINSCIGIWEYDKVKVIEDMLGNKIVPSVVSFGSDRLVGGEALDQWIDNPQTAVSNVMRLIGRRYSDPAVQHECQTKPYKIVCVEKDKPSIQVEYKGETKSFSPEMILAMILRRLKENAEAYLGTNVKGAIITVPAYFDDNQRQFTKAAGIMAGLNVLRILNKPTAAVIAYGLDKINGDVEKNVLVFDQGGVLNIAILGIECGIFELKALSGNSQLGGEAFDNRMVNYFVEEFKKKHNVDISKNARSLRRLTRACERAKRKLSSSEETNIEIESLYEGIDFNTTITRSCFEEINMDLFKSCILPIQQALTNGNLRKEQIDHVVLVGGSSRIPKIQSLLQEFFNGKELTQSIEPDEVVAHGAAIQAGILTETRSQAPAILCLLCDLSPVNVGIETNGGIMTTIIPRDSMIPVKKSLIFSTAIDNQTAISIRVFEGMRTMAKDNQFLGFFELQGIPPMPRGEPQIEVSIDFDANARIIAAATDKSSGNRTQLNVIRNYNAQKIPEKLVEEGKKFKDEDSKVGKRVEAKNQLENCAYLLKKILRDDELAENLSEEDKENLGTTAVEVIGWLEKHQSATIEEIEQQQIHIEHISVPIISKIIGEGKTPQEFLHRNDGVLLLPPPENFPVPLFWDYQRIIQLGKINKDTIQ